MLKAFLNQAVSKKEIKMPRTFLTSCETKRNKNAQAFLTSREQKRNKNAQSRNRTSDTRIFSPLLYQLSYLGIWSVNCCASQAL